MDASARPKEGFPWDLRESWHTYYVYVSTTHEDFLSELQLLFDDVLPELQRSHAAKRIKVILPARKALKPGCFFAPFLRGVVLFA